MRLRLSRNFATAANRLMSNRKSEYTRGFDDGVDAARESFDHDIYHSSAGEGLNDPFEANATELNQILYGDERCHVACKPTLREWLKVRRDRVRDAWLVLTGQSHLDDSF